MKYFFLFVLVFLCSCVATEPMRSNSVIVINETDQILDIRVGLISRDYAESTITMKLLPKEADSWGFRISKGELVEIDDRLQDMNIKVEDNCLKNLKRESLKKLAIKSDKDWLIKITASVIDCS